MTDTMHELAGLYVVDALTPEETRDFEEHLAECPTCPQEVAEMREVTVWLSRTEAAEPPATLRTSVLGLIDSTPQETAPAPAPPRHRSLETGGEVVAMPTKRTSRLPYLVAAAAVLIAFAFGGWALQSRNDANEANEQRNQIVSLLGEDDVRVGTAPGANGGTGTVVASENAGEALFVAIDLPALADGKVYELWTIHTSPTPAPAGTFTPTSGAQVVPLPDAALDAASIAVSVEPAGGSPQPTTTPLMLVTLPKA